MKKTRKPRKKKETLYEKLMREKEEMEREEEEERIKKEERRKRREERKKRKEMESNKKDLTEKNEIITREEEQLEQQQLQEEQLEEVNVINEIKEERVQDRIEKERLEQEEQQWFEAEQKNEQTEIFEEAENIRLENERIQLEDQDNLDRIKKEKLEREQLEWLEVNERRNREAAEKRFQQQLIDQQQQQMWYLELMRNTAIANQFEQERNQRNEQKQEPMEQTILASDEKYHSGGIPSSLSNYLEKIREIKPIKREPEEVVVNRTKKKITEDYSNNVRIEEDPDLEEIPTDNNLVEVIENDPDSNEREIGYTYIGRDGKARTGEEWREIQRQTKWVFSKPKTKEEIAEARRLEKKYNYDQRVFNERWEAGFGPGGKAERVLGLRSLDDSYERREADKLKETLKIPAVQKLLGVIAEDQNPKGVERFKKAKEAKDDKKINSGYIRKKKETDNKTDNESDKKRVLTTQDIQRKYNERVQREKEEKERIKRIQPQKPIIDNSEKRIWTITEIKKKLLIDILIIVYLLLRCLENVMDLNLNYVSLVLHNLQFLKWL